MPRVSVGFLEGLALGSLPGSALALM